MKYSLGCDLAYDVAQPSTLIFNLGIVSNEYQTVLEETLNITSNNTPDQTCETHEFSGGDRWMRVNVPSGELQVTYRATVNVSHDYVDPATVVEIPPAQLPIDLFPYLYPSRYCQSDQLAQLALSEFGHLQPGYSRVTGICNWIYEKVTYLSGSTDSQTSAYDTAMQRQGVCRDFAHLGIAFCRALNIPARIVVGYAYGLQPPDFHACFEAYLSDGQSPTSGRWYLFDATRLIPQNGLIRIATGRDAADVSFATIFGSVNLKHMQLFVDFIPDTNAPDQEQPVPTTEAIAFA